MFKNYVTVPELTKEVAVAIRFDLRDNPSTQELLDDLVERKGEKGKQEFIGMIEEDIKREYAKDPRPPIFPWTRAAFRTHVSGGTIHAQFGLGFLPLIAGALSAITGAATSIFTARRQAKARLKIARMELARRAEEARAAQAIAEANARQVEAAMKANVTGLRRRPAPMGILGIPTLPLIAAGGIAILLAVKFLKV